MNAKSWSQIYLQIHTYMLACFSKYHPINTAKLLKLYSLFLFFFKWSFSHQATSAYVYFWDQWNLIKHLKIWLNYHSWQEIHIGSLEVQISESYPYILGFWWLFHWNKSSGVVCFLVWGLFCCCCILTQCFPKHQTTNAINSNIL